MFHLISIFKSLAVTLVIVLLLQVKVGDDTLEDRAVFLFRSSSLVQPIQTVADGGARLVRNSINKIANLFDLNLFSKISTRPGQRDLNIQIERSREYIREQAEKVARKMDAELEAQSEPTSE